MVGITSNYTVEYCYWITNPGVGSRHVASSSHIVTSSDLKGYASILGETYFKNDTNNINGGYPILKWQEDINTDI